MALFTPCLLERWPLPGTQEGGARASGGWQEVRRDVLRNLDWLLNTEQPGGLADDRPIPPAVAKSVLCFGVPSYSGKAHSAIDVDELAWEIRERILLFEPRLERSTLAVAAVRRAGKHHFNRLQFRIHGYIRAQPERIELLIQSELDMESGRASLFA
jgi:type VI secretion system protein ImpF